MVKFKPVEADAKTPLLPAPWQQVQQAVYNKEVEFQGRKYELVKYLKQPGYWDRFLCALSAAWHWIKSCGKDKEHIIRRWEEAKGNKMIAQRFGYDLTRKPREPRIKEYPEHIKKMYEEGLKDEKEGNFKDAERAYSEAAKQGGHQEAFDALRNLCEAKNASWGTYYTVVWTVAKDQEVKILRFSPEERLALKKAIDNLNANDLFALAQKLEKESRYPEAVLCYREAAKLGHVEGCKAFERLQRDGFIPYGVNAQQTFLWHYKKLEGLLEKRGTKAIFNIEDEIGDQYENLRTLEDNMVMDVEVVQWKRAALTREAILHFKKAAEVGNGLSLKKLRDYLGTTEISQEEYYLIAQKRNNSLQEIESNAKEGDKDDELLLFVCHEYLNNERYALAEQNPEEIKAWLIKIAKGPFEIKIGRLEDGYNYKVVELSAEAAKMGNPQGMDTFREYGDNMKDMLPRNFVKEVKQAFATAVAPKIEELKKRVEDTNNSEILNELAYLCKLTGNLDEAKKYWARAGTPVSTVGSPMRK